MKRARLVLLFLVVALGFSSLANATISHKVLEKEHLARYCINYASYLIDVGRYLDALDNYQTAIEVTTMPKTKADAMLAKATLLSSFLDAPEKALQVYRKVRKEYKPAAEIAEYREGILLFDMKRYKEAKAILEQYRKAYPTGRFRFQAEALLGEIARMHGVPPVSPPPPVKRKQPDVRVRMCDTSGAAQVAGAPVCAEGLGCRERFSLRVVNGRLLIDQEPVDGAASFESKKGVEIACEEKHKRVRGKLVAKVRDGKLLVLNVLPIEDYLLSVVPSENPASWPLETLKAQAVAARTYAYYQLLHRKDWPYDLVDYAGDQAYGGMAKESPRSTAAVRATSGMVLMYQGKPILAMFSANSGGYTADSRAIFDLDKPYLVARPDPASLKGGMADWTRKFSVSHVVSALGRIGVEADGLESIKSAERGPSGRIVKVRLDLPQGRDMVLRNRTTLRRALSLPEILFGVRREGNTFVFNGHGWGHGVGYSQWGSEYLGKKEDFRQILSFYYQHTRLKKLW